MKKLPSRDDKKGYKRTELLRNVLALTQRTPMIEILNNF